MRISRDVQIGDQRIVVAEMTLGELRAWLSDLVQVPPDLIGDELFEGMTLAEVMRLSTLTPEAAERLTPSEIQQVVDACQEVNRHFFRLRANLLARARQLAPSS